MITAEQQAQLLTPFNTLISDIASTRNTLNSNLKSWFSGEIAAGRADLTHGFTNSDHNDQMRQLEDIYQNAFQYSEFMKVYFSKNTSIEFDEAQQVTSEYYAGVKSAFEAFKSGSGI